MITKTKMSLDEAVETLTGFDEQFIQERFKGELETLLLERPREGMRSVAAVLVARELGGSDENKAAAFEHVMGLTLTQLNAFFSDEAPDAMPDEPDTESGKDASTDA